MFPSNILRIVHHIRLQQISITAMLLLTALFPVAARAASETQWDGFFVNKQTAQKIDVGLSRTANNSFSGSTGQLFFQFRVESANTDNNGNLQLHCSTYADGDYGHNPFLLTGNAVLEGDASYTQIDGHVASGHITLRLKSNLTGKGNGWGEVGNLTTGASAWGRQEFDGWLWNTAKQQKLLSDYAQITCIGAWGKVPDSVKKDASALPQGPAIAQQMSALQQSLNAAKAKTEALHRLAHNQPGADTRALAQELEAANQETLTNAQKLQALLKDVRPKQAEKSINIFGALLNKQYSLSLDDTKHTVFFKIEPGNILRYISWHHSDPDLASTNAYNIKYIDIASVRVDNSRFPNTLEIIFRSKEPLGAGNILFEMEQPFQGETAFQYGYSDKDGKFKPGCFQAGFGYLLLLPTSVSPSAKELENSFIAFVKQQLGGEPSSSENSPSLDPKVLQDLQAACDNLIQQVRTLPKSTDTLSSLDAAPPALRNPYAQLMQATQRKSISGMSSLLAPSYKYKEAGGKTLSLSEWKTVQAGLFSQYPHLRMVVRVEAQEQKGNDLVVTATRTLRNAGDSDANRYLDQKVKETWTQTAGQYRLQSTEILEEKSNAPNVISPKATAPINNLPTPRGAFYIHYQGQSSDRHDFVQTLLGDWIELLPDKTAGVFHTVDRSTVEGNAGTVIQAYNSEFYLFIPDRNATGMYPTLIRQKSGADGSWGAFQYILSSGAESLQQLYFNYQDDPKDRHDLVKALNGDWIEIISNKGISLFHTDSRTNLDGNPGTVIKSDKRDLYLFVPDRNATGTNSDFIKQRNGSNGEWDWFQRILH